MTAFEHQISDDDWRLIGDGVLRGRYNLLLGAGTSLDSPSGKSGERCPSASGLTEILAKLQPGIRAGSPLSRIYKTLTDEQIKNEITDRFQGCEAGETVKELTQFRWNRIFTFNVDDALEAAYESALLPAQQIQTFNYDDHYSEIRDIRRLPIVHLHGYAREPERGYVFDVSEYVKAMRSNNIWAHILGQKIRSDPFIVAGTSFEETDLTYFLAERSDRFVRPDRPPSILIEPFPDEATLVDCNEHSLKLFQGTTLDFLKEVDRRFPTRPSVDEAIEQNVGEDLFKLVNDGQLIARFHADFERVPEDGSLLMDDGPLFAYGHPATWGDIQNGLDVHRGEADEFISKIISSKAGKAWLVFGEAGAGKSTLLKRIAWNFAQGGRLCLYVRAVGRIHASSAAKVISYVKGRCYIFVDNFADNVNEISDLRRLLSNKDVVFIGAERNYRSGHTLKVYGREYVELFSLGEVGVITAGQLSQSYKNLGLLAPGIKKGNPAPLSDELIAIACCRILNNFEPLADIISRSINDASKEEVSCYLLLALASHCSRQGLEYGIASACCPNYQVDIQSEDRGPLPLKTVEVSGAEFVRPLNEAFSDTILKILAHNRQDAMLNAFIQIASVISPRVNPGAIERGEPCARLAARLFDFDEVVRPLLGLDLAEEFYKKTKGGWDWNSRYWHQIAQMRLDLADREQDKEKRLALANLAVQHARFSKIIESKHQFTYTTIGRTIFGKFNVMRATNAPELSEAINALILAIKIEQERKRITVHPYMILFEGLESEISRGAMLSPDERSKVRTKILESRYKFPKDVDLREKGNRLLAVL